jgi:hypothetical protein
MDAMGRRRPAAMRAAVLILMAAPGSGGAQGNTTGPDTLAFPDRRSWEVAGVPALAFDSDEGFGYGVALELYRHAHGPAPLLDGRAAPYLLTLQPQLSASTRGRRSASLFLDVPRLGAAGWRVTGTAGYERHPAIPWYGAGNDAVWNRTRSDPDGTDPHFHRFGRTRLRAMADVQRPLGSENRYRLLVGAGSARVEIDAAAPERGTTLLREEFDAAGVDEAGGWAHHVRLGLVRDTRDREVGPTRGAWSDVVVQQVVGVGQGGASFLRWTVTDRRYVGIAPGLVFANRWLLQGVQGSAPFHELQVVQTTYRPEEGLGGARTLRGIPKNRFAGEGMFLWNAELRWHAAEGTVAGRQVRLVLSGFVDQGRVWNGAPVPGEILSDLHRGAGMGARVGLGENFLVALDLGRSREAGAAIYMGLGYLF